MKSLKLVLATLLLTAVSRVRAKPEYKKFIPNADAFLKEIGAERDENIWLNGTQLHW